MYLRNIHIHRDSNLKVSREKTRESDMKSLLTVLSLCLGISFGYYLSCPDVSQWSIRARLLCPDPSKYYCLWDGNAKVFKENCSKVDLTRAGERLVIQYNFDSKFCPKDVYQPYPHFTNESSGCIYKKSTCNEEGQVVYDDTDTKHDIKCTCDYTRGYDFITRPYNPCYCIPSEEDCSCYLNPCMMPELESDSRCTNATKLSHQNNCAPIQNSSEEDTQDTRPIMRNDDKATETVSELDQWNDKAAASVFCLIRCILLCSGLIVYNRVSIDDKLNEKIRKVYVVCPLVNATYDEGAKCNLQCKVSKLKTNVKWFKNGVCIDTSNNILISCVGRLHTLTINEVSIEDAADYELRLRRHNYTHASVTVKHDKIKTAEYLDDIKKKTEKRFYIRVMIVGEHGVGKSCLLRRLLKEGIEGVESTDGIDIVVRRCKIRLSDGKWIFDADQDPKREYAARIKRAIAQETQEQETRAIVQESFENEEKAMKMITLNQNTEHSGHELETADQHEGVQITVPAEDRLSGHQPQTFASEQNTNTTQEREKPTQRTGGSTSTRKVTKVLTDDVEQELEHFLSRIDKYENENEDYVEIGFWDFAGEKDYYGTHYTFLDSHALYLLVTDCSVDIQQTKPGDTYDSIGSYIDFWFDTIHNCRDVEEENTDTHLNPPIIAVCTGLDKLTEKVNEKKDTFLQRLKDAIRDGQKRNHLRDVCFVSNTNESGSDFDHVRKLIFDWGKKLQSFGKELPLKWIRLEQSLDVVRRGGYNIIAREDVIDLAKKCDIHETEEVEQFLKHQHKIGSIIYCDDINKYVILTQKWLADAFKCLVSDKIDNTIKMSDEWETLSKTGILEITLITKLFQKEKKLDFSKYEDHILQVLIKFDIVGINVEQDKDIYYMPYMIKSSTSLPEVVDHFGVSNARKTPWLCYEFDFLPLPFFTYVMLYFIRHYTMCFDTKLNKRSIYHGIGVFLLDQTRDLKFIVLFCKNTVAFQIWHWGDFPKERYQTSLIEFQKVIDNLKRKYEAKNLRDYVKVKCSEGDVNSKIGRMSYRDILDDTNSGKYFCDECNRTHDSNKLLDTWFYNYSNDKEMNSNTDTNRDKQDVKTDYATIKMETFPETQRDTESFDSVRCQLCVSDPRPAVYWCTECVQAMCRECTNVHRTQPTSSTHTTVLLTCDYNFQIKGININDIASLCEGVLIIIDIKGKQLITCDIRGHNKQFIPLPYSPDRLSVIDQNNVAVTAYDNMKVFIVDVTQKNITKQFDIKKGCYGIMYRDNHLYVGCYDLLVKVDMSGEIIRTVPLSFTPRYICSGTEGRIYCTDIISNTVYCIDTEGNTVFTVTNPDMSSPYAITTDNEGHVLVACHGSNNVHRISPDGKQCNVIIEDIPSSIKSYPRICYDSISKSIVIGGYDTVYVYKI